MLRIVLVRPGSTDFDDQGRIKGSLDIPMNAHGAEQTAEIVEDLSSYDFQAIYHAPHQDARQTAEALSAGRETKLKALERLRNLDHGLWHGKLIEEVKRGQPKVYRQWQEQPETVCPPEGETVAEARQRVDVALSKMFRKHRSGVIAIVTAEPLASVVRSSLDGQPIGDLWKMERQTGGWELLSIEPVAIS